MVSVRCRNVIYHFLIFVIAFGTTKRRTGTRQWDFEARPGMGNLVQPNEESKEGEDNDNTTDGQIDSGDVPQKHSSERELDQNTISDSAVVDSFQVEAGEDVKAKQILEQAMNGTETPIEFTFDDEHWNTSLLAETKDKKVLWVDATFKAVDIGLNISDLPECNIWRNFWAAKEAGNITDNFQLIKAENRSADETGNNELIEYEVIDSIAHIEKLLPLEKNVKNLLGEHDALGILFVEVCGKFERNFFYNTPEDAKAIGMTNGTLICEPFKKELHPDEEQLKGLEAKLNEAIQGKLNGSSQTTIKETTTTMSAPKRRRRRGEAVAKRKSKEERKDKTFEESGEAGKEDDSSEEKEEELPLFATNLTMQTAEKEAKPVTIDNSDETNPVLVFASHAVAQMLQFRVPPRYFQRYEKVGLHLPGICSEYVPKAIDAFNASEFEGVEIEGPIGVNISALESAGVNLTELAEKLRNDTEVDQVLTRTQGMSRSLGGSYILPVLNKNQYDPFSPPIVFQGSAVVVRFGIYIESMSNFQTTTMDYDMDIYLIMGWRDPRLVNSFDKPVLVKEEEILEKIWRPDPFFDAKEAEFHEVTFLNFLMRIYSDGLILYETRIKLKPACNLILCKYPHDKQTCELQIKSFAYPSETVRFEWFTNRKDAIDKNPDVRLPELYINQYEPAKCNRTRKSGEFACLRAVFRLKRDVGFHIAQTYIPTSLALMFSWVGVWLPEEFMEGRIGVAITVLLTLSTESAGAREHLPSVSYLKAIDLWFGYITGFVFFTLLQTLFVIGFDKRANQLRKWATKKRIGKAELSQEARDEMAERAARYHKLGRYLDNCCRVFYPLSFTLFLILYYFVFTEGQQDDCIADRQ